MLSKKKGQVWIETVTYTMIAFVLIALVIGFARPKIEEIQDQAIIEQSLKIIKEMDLKIQEISETGEGNKRKVELTIKKGELRIDSSNDTLFFIMEGRYMYSQPGQSYMDGGINITTTEQGKVYTITFEKKYENLDLKFSNEEELKKLPRGTTPYELFISNEGGDVINLQLG
ncbi:hypothetical protein JXM83_00025 [Candidatus Woesearchaeota archaeon]|nr:hypothetical protein [Candidatus Woesearchaeota archaeon]